MASIVIPGYELDVSQHTSNTDSISASLEHPDMGDFDEEPEEETKVCIYMINKYKLSNCYTYTLKPV